MFLVKKDAVDQKSLEDQKLSKTLGLHNDTKKEF